MVETSPRSMWHSHDVNGRSKTNSDVTSQNVTLHYYVAGNHNVYLHEEACM